MATSPSPYPTEMLAGITPFYAESVIVSLLMRSQQRAVPLSDINKLIPGPLSNIVAKCLETDPAFRYKNAEAVLADLRAWQGTGGNSRISASATRMRINRARALPWPRIALTAICFFAWRSTEPDSIADPKKYDPNFKFKPEDMATFQVTPNIPKLIDR